ncbi:MAG: hypothetical protein HC899_09505 [Leptolyngbyaceae cyanobacterium SM1_4_3]|nr:hypothetical protein [Leptolyngbyaceae cyanobacterium SM1_4_3]NJN90487.1 hypothetical protein [Leptolyngbyaceae cyanobacterium SL_5_14]
MLALLSELARWISNLVFVYCVSRFSSHEGAIEVLKTLVTVEQASCLLNSDGQDAYPTGELGQGGDRP